MEKIGVEILDVNVDELIKMLKDALCEEWLAYY
jgi:ferritin-like protein